MCSSGHMTIDLNDDSSGKYDSSMKCSSGHMDYWSVYLIYSSFWDGQADCIKKQLRKKNARNNVATKLTLASIKYKH